MVGRYEGVGRFTAARLIGGLARVLKALGIFWAREGRIFGEVVFMRAWVI